VSAPPGTGRVLWRAEADVGHGGRRPALDLSDWRHQAIAADGVYDAMGRWFTDRPELLAFYAADCPGGFRVVRVEVDAAESEAWRVSGQPAAARFSRDAENEFFVPRAVAEAAAVDEAMTEEVGAAIRPSRRFP